MKKLKKILINAVIIAYAVVAIAVTILLLSYNEYHCSVLGGYTFILVTDDELEPDFAEGSLIIVKQVSAKKIERGDNIFLYRKISNTEHEIKYAEVLVKNASNNGKDAQYVLEGSTMVSHNDVIGSTDNMKVIPHMGTVLSILESRYGYLFLIVVVSFIAFLYEIYELVMEIKYGDREEDDEDEDYDDDDDEYYEYEDDDYDYEDEEEEEVVVRRPRKTTTAKRTTTAAPRKTTARTTAKTVTRTTSTARKTTPAKRTTTAGTAKKTTTTRKTGAGTTTRKTGAAAPKKQASSTTTTRKRTTKQQ